MVSDIRHEDGMLYTVHAHEAVRLSLPGTDMSYIALLPTDTLELSAIETVGGFTAVMALKEYVADGVVFPGAWPCPECPNYTANPVYFDVDIEESRDESDGLSESN